MKALVNTAPGRLEWTEWPTPEPGPGAVRVRTGACGICATDLEMIRGWQRTGFPAIPGHEWAGVVDAVGPGGDASLLGRRCVAENVLSDGGEVGFEHPGGYGQYLITESRNVHLLPDDFPLAAATLIEPLAVCVRALGRLRLEEKRGQSPFVRSTLRAVPANGDCPLIPGAPDSRRSAVIFGDGPIGLLMLLLLKAEGSAHVVLVGGREKRLDLARQFGATATLNYHQAQPDLAGAVTALSASPFPNVIEASGSPAAMQTSLDVAAHGGKILVIGDYGAGRANFDWNRILHGELELIGSNASAGGWTQAVELAATGRIPLERLVSERLPAAEGAEGVKLVQQSRDLVKVVLEWSSCQ